MNTKKKHNSNNIIDWIFIFIFLAFATVITFNYIDLKNPTIQMTAIFLVETLLTIVFMLLTLLDSIQRELYNIKESLDELYDIKQINDLRSIVNKRHLEKLLNDIWKKIYGLEEK